MLERLASLAKPIRVGIVGAGSMGKGLTYQCGITPGMECVALADILIDRAVACAETLGRPHRVVTSAAEMHDAISEGLLAICADGLLVATCEAVDVLVESSNAIVEGAGFVIAALEVGKSAVLMNAEIDLTFGPYFVKLARDNGVVCSSCDGDQYGVIKHLADELTLWGFELVMAGNIKGFLNRDANPTNIASEADKRNLDYKMCSAYTDGTKLCVEMALLANALGLHTDVPGMHGPRAEHVSDALTLFDLESMWDGSEGVVDYILGAEPNGGVFAIGYCDNPYQQQMLAYYKMGPGPFYVFYRPYHLCHVESMASIAEAFLDGKMLLEPKCGFRTNVYAYAKRDLKKGEELDGMGGHACYGMIENCGASWQDEALPICLSEGVRLTRDVDKDEPVWLRDVAYDANSPGFDLYARAREAGRPDRSCN